MLWLWRCKQKYLNNNEILNSAMFLGNNMDQKQERNAMATKRKNTTPSLSIGHMESHQHTSSSYHNNFLTTFKHWWGSTFNTSKWLMQPFSSFIAWSISGLILRKRSFNNFADTGWPDFPSKMRSRMVRICGLLEKNKACCQWCAKL